MVHLRTDILKDAERPARFAIVVEERRRPAIQMPFATVGPDEIERHAEHVLAARAAHERRLVDPQRPAVHFPTDR